jgi:superfamily II DNA or RNA helicase
MPISWKATVSQYAGRFNRDHADKREVAICDYIDTAVPVLEEWLKNGKLDTALWVIAFAQEM